MSTLDAIKDQSKGLLAGSTLMVRLIAIAGAQRVTT
jgi:hypothetical protein